MNVSGMYSEFNSGHNIFETTAKLQLIS